MRKFFSGFKTASVAFSGGADSTCVLMLAIEFLGAENVTAYTCANSHIFRYEIENAAVICDRLGVKHVMFQADMPPEFFTDKETRCYHCKRAILNKIKELSDADVILDGTNADDNPDDRPGYRALKETETVSPLKELGLGKAFSLRTVSELGIEFHDESCKASRLITIDEGSMYEVEAAEDCLRHRYKGIRYRRDENRVVFKHPAVLREDDFQTIKNIIKDTMGF
ncbi:MAG: hypothetical protein AB7E96_02305 [Deferribacterales bacterium]